MLGENMGNNHYYITNYILCSNENNYKQKIKAHMPRKERKGRKGKDSEERMARKVFALS